MIQNPHSVNISGHIEGPLAAAIAGDRCPENAGEISDEVARNRPP